MSEARNIYFVRHGQSMGNMEGYVQGAHTPLSSEGLRQAELVAQRFQNIEVNRVVTSPYDRARETGTKIAVLKKVDLVSDENFRELQRPSRIVGESLSTPAVQEVVTAYQKNWSVRGWKLEDGDNFEETLERVKKGLHFLSQDTTGDVVVVSHANLLRILINYVLTGSENPEHYRTVVDKKIMLSNTGISHAQYRREVGWYFVSINDSTHLS